MAEPVLLTGARGFVGRAVLDELVARGVPVQAVSRSACAPQPGVTWHRADLLDPGDRARLLAEARAPRLIHCAWEVTHGAFWTSPANDLWRAASRDLVAGFLAGGGQRVIGLGSCAEYDAAAPGPWNEARPLAPATRYGREKAGLFSDLERIAGEKLLWARLFHLYGPGEDPQRLIPSLIAALRDGRPAEVRAARLVRDYASTAHVARGLVRLLDSPASGAMDIGSGEARTLGQLAAILADLAGRRDLLHLSHTPSPTDPPSMAPTLERMRENLGVACERPETGLARLWQASTAP
jgi:nucleoside-diphosphate-sugar epimerase